MPDKQGFGLVLSRRVGESIVISDNIVVTVTRIENGKVRLGIEAPKEVPIHRCDKPEHRK